MALRVLGVAGSMRTGASSTRALSLVLEAARQRGADVVLLDLRTADLPVFSPDAREPAEAVRTVAEQVRWAGAYVLATPDYHGSMSGAMKNFLDYHWHDLAGKLFGYVCSSHEKGLTAMDQLRTVVRQCYGWSLPYGAALHGDHDFAADGSVANHRLQSRLEMLARDLVVYGTVLREQFQRDRESRDPESFAARYAE